MPDREKPEELIRNMLAAASTNGWYRCVIRCTAEGRLLELDEIIKSVVKDVASEQGIDPEVMAQRISPESVQHAVTFMTNTGVFLKTDDGQYCLSLLAKKHLKLMEPFSHNQVTAL